MYKQKLTEALERNPFEQLTNVIYKIIKEEIISLRLKPETKINLSELAKDLQTSRTPVREAMKRLCDENLLKTEDGKKGYFVCPVSRSTIEQLFVSRMMIEGEAAYICALNHYNIDLTTMRQLGEEYKETFDKSDFSNYVHLEMAFHKALIYAADNPFFIQMYETIETLLLYYANLLQNYRMVHPKHPNDNNQSLPMQHLSIVNAIETGVPQIAQEALINHLRTGEYYMQMYINL